ncbi:bone marrow proteoglycan isoform X2 [Equus caballus]|uniref:bone marrow proteoglycan isoform X2 n=1 Tax=Equus caballus TaxID=9796 RepID=UPI000C9DBAD2|nr:bone marrow proteoglycan isoform X2 [Equus caballus]
MKLPLLLALLFGAVSALPLRIETSNFESPLGDDTLPQDGEMPEHGAMYAPTEGMMLPEGEEEGGSGSEDDPEEEGLIKSVSALEEVDKDFQCPNEEDTIKLEGIPGCKTSRFIVNVCRRCYRGNLVSIHSYHLNYRLQCSVRCINQGQVWIGGIRRGWRCRRRFRWTDGSRWNFSYWASGQPRKGRGRCVALCTRGGHWRRVPCSRRLPFICSS